MDLNKYTLFADVAETKNFTKTGERMGYTQPGVSHILKTLENELGFPLFLRTKRGIKLTPNAEVILPIVRNMLAINEQLEQTISSLKGLDTGHLTIASFASISRNWLPRAIHEFQVDYPGINPDIRFSSKDDLAIVSMVANNLGVSILPKLVIKGMDEKVLTLPLEPYSFHFCLFLHYTETINKGVAEKLVFSTVFKTDVR